MNNSVEQHVRHWEPWLRKTRHFTLYVNYFRGGSTREECDEQIARTEETFARSWAEVVRPALTAATRCRLYDLRWLTHPGGHRKAQTRYPDETRDRWRDTYFRTTSGGTEVDLSAKGVLDDVDLWWWLVGSGAKPVFIAPTAAVDLAGLFARSFDPHCIGNLGASVPKSAIAFAKRATGDAGHIALQPRRGSYQGQLTIFASADECVRLFGEAIARATLSGTFLPHRSALGLLGTTC